MRVSAFLMALGLAVAAAPAFACTRPPEPIDVYWLRAPETLRPNEVALEVVFVRHPAEEELEPKDLNARDRIVIVSCGKTERYTYRVLRVLSGDYHGPAEINTSVSGGITNEFKDGQRRIVVGELTTHDGWPPIFQMRVADVPAHPFPIPEIPLN